MKNEVMFIKDNNVGIITLNRPDRLNALTHSMVVQISETLSLWEADKNISCVIIEGVGDRSFCAGGDVVKLRKEVLADGGPPTDLSRGFFYDEYTLNYKISNYKKPFISLINGYTMGGGVGVSMHGSHIVGSEKTLFAMPETAIGLFPDVGGGWLLGQLDSGIGAWLSLVGAKIKAYDLMKLKLITHHVPSNKIKTLKENLISSSPNTNEKVNSIINQYCENPNSSESTLLENDQIIKDAFSFDTVEEIFNKCEFISSSGNEFITSQLDELKHKSPTSLKISLRQIRSASKMNLKDELIMEYRMVQKCVEIGDFFEGVRAMLVEKDRKPAWNPSNIKEIDDDKVNKFFESLGDQDLILTK